MDAAVLARIQFAFTAGFHFLFPPLSIGLAWLLLVMYHRWVRSGSAHHKANARFWTGLFTLTFAIGVATGITLEFQFGTNWAAYSRFVGDIFGAPLAAEGVLAFFLESTFLGVLLYGFDRFSPRTLRFAALMVAVGSTLSAFWIIVANSWMQTPAGFAIEGGRAVLTDFVAAVFNPSTVVRYLHVIAASVATGAFFMLGISALYLRRGRHRDLAAESLKIGLVAAFAASIVQASLGHLHAMQVAEHQPEKLAAMEALFDTQARAPLIVLGVPDAKSGRVKSEIRIPALLSILAFGTPDAVVRGLNEFPRDEWPPVGEVFWSFHLMVGIGTWMIVLTAFGLLLWWRGRLLTNRPFLTAAVWTIPLPFLANELGWMVTELGRQPWIVYRVMKTADAISASVPAGQIAASLALFVVVYGLLFWLWIRLIRKKVAAGPAPEGTEVGR